MAFKVIEVFTQEDIGGGSVALVEKIINRLDNLKLAARCQVFKGVAGGYENGERALQTILDLSHNMPVKIEIVLPAAEAAEVVEFVDALVTEGIVGVRDLEIVSYKTQNRLFPRHIRVKDIMTGNPVRAQPETPVSDLLRHILTAVFNGLPVVNAQEMPVGMVTQSDFIYRAHLPLRVGLLAQTDAKKLETFVSTLSGIRAEQIMTTPVVTVTAEAFVLQAVEIMVAKNVKRLPVTGANGQLVGMLSRLDIFRMITEHTPDWGGTGHPQIKVDNLRYVEDIMQREVQAVLPNEGVAAVVKIIDKDAIQRVAVVDEAGKLLGLISDRELLPVFLPHADSMWRHMAKTLRGKKFQSQPRKIPEALADQCAADVMLTDLVVVRETDRLETAIERMVQHALKRLPVIDDKGVFKGMISRDALLKVGWQHHPSLGR